MEIMTIIYIVAAFIVGGLISFFIARRGKTEEVASPEKVKELERAKADLIAQLNTVAQKSSEKLALLKEKYEGLLSETNKQCEDADRKLKAALEGNVDEAIKGQLAQVDALKAKIKALEEEIEDQEDDIDSLKKKIKNKESELEETQDSLSKEQSESKQLRTELDSVKQQLEDKVAELTLKKGSIDFVQELLSAKEIGDKGTLKLNKNIDFFEQFVKGYFMDVNNHVYTTYTAIEWENKTGQDGFKEKKKHFLSAFESWAAVKRKSWLDGKTTIAFVGEFSAGKTSIVNRILSQDDPNVPKLPVSTKATTAIPTYIAGGEYVSYTFIAGDGKRKQISENTFKQVSKEILDQIKGISSLIKYFVMTYKNPNLDGLSILDTPGFNSNDSEDRERTIDVINECDALFWVFDVNAGTVNRSSIAIIKEKLNKPLYVVINKVDTKSDSEVQKVEELIQKTLSDEGLEVMQFIRFSSKAPLETIMEPIQHVGKIAGRDSFVEDVKADIEWMLNLFEKWVKEQNANFHDKEKEYSENTDYLNSILHDTHRDCDYAASIPHWETHFWSSDRYEMSATEGNQLMTTLERIATQRLDSIIDGIEKRTALTEDIQETYIHLCDLKATWQKLNECYEQYKKVSKNIK